MIALGEPATTEKTGLETLKDGFGWTGWIHDNKRKGYYYTISL